jgi:hypothetical protein
MSAKSIVLQPSPPITSILDTRLPQPPYRGLPQDIVGRLATLREERTRCAEVFVPDIDRRLIALLLPFRDAE